MMRKTVEIGLAIAIAALAIVGATFIFRARQPLSEKEAVELAREYVESGHSPMVILESIELRLAVLSPIERIAELSPHEQDMLAEHSELPDKMWVVEFDVEYRVLGMLSEDGTTAWGKDRVVIDAYTGDKLSLIKLLPEHPSFTRGS